MVVGNTFVGPASGTGSDFILASAPDTNKIVAAGNEYIGAMGVHSSATAAKFLTAIGTEHEDKLRIRFRQLTAAPSTIADGDLVYADGSNWDPGDGEGVYARENGSWKLLSKDT